jgi:ArsR family transcriptional regulator
MVLPTRLRYPVPMADIFDAIADTTRRRILDILNERGGAGEITAVDLAAELGVTPPTATRHLAVLREQGFVSAREEGRLRYFRLELEPFERLRSWTSSFVDEETDEETDEEFVSSDHEATVFAAWAGADVGSTLGRVLAERSHHARSVIQGASERVTQVLPESVAWRRRSKS